MSDDSSLEPASEFSILMWVEPTYPGDTEMYTLIDKGTRDGGYALWLDNDTNGKLHLNGGLGNDVSSADTVSEGEWSLAGFTYDGTNVTFYINGKKAGTGGWELKDYFQTNLWIGFDDDYFSGELYFDGKLDELRIYDRTLSQAQVEYLNDTNKAMGRYVDITVYNAGTEEVPKGTWIANLKKDGTTVDSDSYNASKLPPEERITLNFYFDKMKPGKEYKIELEGTGTSTTVSC